MFARRLWRAAAPLLVFSSMVFGQDDAVVITASRTEQRLRDAIAHTTVLGRKEIEDSQAVDLPSLLRREAGVEVMQNGGVGGVAALFMRGNRPSQSLVLVDGVRVEDAGFGTSAIQHLMLEDIDRIEIVRGNVSSLYGSGAIGGVVQIFTRQARGTPAPYGEAMAGSRRSSALRAGYGGELEALRFNFTASRFDTRGFSQIDPRLAPAANPDPDGYRNESTSGNLAFRLGARHSVGASFLASRGRVDTDGVDAFASPPDAPTFSHRSAQDLGMLQAWWEARFLERWTSRITLAQGSDYRTDERNGSFDNRSNTRSRQLVWDHELRLAPSHRLTAGIEGLRQDLVNEGFFAVGKRSREVGVLRSGYLGRLGRHSFQANARTEDYSDFGRADTYFAGYGLDVTEAWRLTAATSTAFRAPTFQDLFGFGGNPQLRAERARTHELGVQWAHGGAQGANRIRLVAFDTEYRDAISFDPVTFTAANVGRASVTGWETSYSGRVLGVDLRVALTLQDPVEGENDVRGVRRAKRFGSVSAARSFGRWRLGADLSGAGERRDFHIATGVDVRQPGYEVLNLTARYAFSRELFAALRVENALDKDYSVVHGYNSAPRGAFVTVGWQP